MISEDTQRMLDAAEEEMDQNLTSACVQFEKSAKLLVILGICLGFYYRSLGPTAVLIVGILPLLLGMIVVFWRIAVVVRKYLRLCDEIIGSDDDPDPDNEEDIPEEPKEISESAPRIIQFPKSNNNKKAA